MNWREDVWKFVALVSAILTAIAAHTIKLPPAWEPAMPYVEFCAGVSAVIVAVYISKPVSKS